MQLALLADDDQWSEWEESGGLLRVGTPGELVSVKADVYIDLLFRNTPERVALLAELLPATVIVNAVEETLGEIHPDFVRCNGWPGFLAKAGLELAWNNEAAAKAVETACALLQKTVQRVPDIPGLVSPRVIAMIVNEAFFALEEGVSTKVEIDTAMKLGTNYPLGPFEWGEKIGLERICSLLERLNGEDERYRPAEALKAIYK